MADLYNNTALLLSFNGDDDSQYVEDRSQYGHTVTFFDNAKISTVEKKFGSASLLLRGPGTQDCIGIPNHAKLRFSATKFTIELFAYFTQNPGSTMMFMSSISGGGVQWLMSTTSMRFYMHGVGTVVATVGFAPTLYQWYHIAACKDGTSLRFFINGNRLGDVLTVPLNLTATYGTLYVGHDAGASSRVFPGRIDELRILDNEAIYTENFTPPTSEFLISKQVRKDLKFIYNNGQTVSKDLTFLYSVYNFVRKNITFYYSVYTTAQNSFKFIYNSGQTVKKDLTFVYDSNQFFRKDFIFVYNSGQVVRKDLKFIYDSNQFFRKDLKFIYNNGQLVSKNLIFVYNSNQFIRKSFTFKYNIRTAVKKTFRFLYNVRGIIQKHLIFKYNVRTAVSKEFTFLYNVYESVLLDLIFKYNVRKSESKVLTFIYDVLSEEQIDDLLEIIRILIDDTLVTGQTHHVADFSNSFKLQNSIIRESSIKVYKNNVLLDGDYYYNTSANSVILNTVSKNDDVLITYQHYETYSDTELIQYIKLALMELSARKYNKLFYLDNNNALKSSNDFNPDQSEKNLIATITSVLINPKNHKITTPEYTLSSIEKKSTKQQIDEIVLQKSSFDWI